MGRLDGKVAIVTGASRGIGAAIVKKLAEEGAQVFACARSIESGRVICSVSSCPTRTVAERSNGATSIETSVKSRFIEVGLL